MEQSTCLPCSDKDQGDRESASFPASCSLLKNFLSSEEEQDAKGSSGRHHRQWVRDMGEAILLDVCLDSDKGGELLLRTQAAKPCLQYWASPRKRQPNNNSMEAGRRPVIEQLQVT
jgi:hypothetical protein